MRVPGLHMRIRRNSLILLMTVISALLIYLLLTLLVPGSNLSAGKQFSRIISETRRQKEYIDDRGMHVIVGHYMGDVPPANFTDAELNENSYDPISASRSTAGALGRGVFIPAALASRAKRRFNINQFNVVASDLMALNRSLPDMRRPDCANQSYSSHHLPRCSVIIVFHNEAWSTLLRTVHSVIDRSPRHLLTEILLVDDASERSFLGRPLEVAVSTLAVPVRVLRMNSRAGLIRARLLGAQNASGDVLVFLDAHCECTVGWLEPLLSRVWSSPRHSAVVSPVIDIINADTFAYTRSLDLHWGTFNWRLHFRWLMLTPRELQRRHGNMTRSFRTPAMAGGLFAVSRQFFYEIGSYDRHMDIWGGENIEMSLRVWMCGGSVEIHPCSHVGHVFRSNSPYTFPRPGGVSGVLYHNLARVALSWLDQWSHFYFRLNPEAAKIRHEVDVRSRLELRRQMRCHNFSWYLHNVWPDHFFPTDDRLIGQLINCDGEECLQRPPATGHGQPASLANVAKCLPDSDIWFSSQLFVITEHGYVVSDESVCLDAMTPDKMTNNTEWAVPVRIHGCSQIDRQRWRFESVLTGSPACRQLVHVDSGLCLTQISGQTRLQLNVCVKHDSRQRWRLRSFEWR